MNFPFVSDSVTNKRLYRKRKPFFSFFFRYLDTRGCISDPWRSLKRSLIWKKGLKRGKNCVERERCVCTYIYILICIYIVYIGRVFVEMEKSAWFLCHLIKIRLLKESGDPSFVSFLSWIRWTVEPITGSHSPLPTGRPNPKESPTGSRRGIRRIPREASIIPIYLASRP